MHYFASNWQLMRIKNLFRGSDRKEQNDDRREVKTWDKYQFINIDPTCIKLNRDFFY